MPSRKLVITGWVLSVLVALFLIGASGLPKFIQWDGKEEMMGKLGLPLSVLPYIGAVEIACAVLFIIPRTCFIGAILLTGYLGGATFAHVRINDQFFMPIVMGVIAWTSLGLRYPVIFQWALNGPPATGK
jgi:uncharacterized membrane protein YphA (DoxX/SURF4 family)